jgi:hypothetical protein
MKRINVGIWIIVLLVFTQCMYASPGRLWVGSASSGVLGSSVPGLAALTGIKVEVDIKPVVINIDSKGKYTAFIRFPNDPCLSEAAGRQVLLHFNIQELNLENVVSGEIVTLYIKGTLNDGTEFWGTDEVRVLSDT